MQANACINALMQITHENAVGDLGRADYQEEKEESGPELRLLSTSSRNIDDYGQVKDDECTLNAQPCSFVYAHPD